MRYPRAVRSATPTPGSARPTATRQPWVRGPWWDGFWILNGLWLAPLLWWLARGHPTTFESPADHVFMVVTLLFWIGHRVGSSYLAYCTTAYRPLLRAQPVRFVVVPCLVAVAVFAYVLLPTSVLPIDPLRRIFYLAIADYLFVTYHFAAQHYGLLSLYRVRGHEPRSRRTRLLDRLFALGIGGVVVVGAELIAGRIVRQDLWLDPTLARWWDPDAYTAWYHAYRVDLVTIGRSLVAAATIAVVIGALRRRNLPRALYALSVGAMVWVAFRVSPYLFVMVWSAQHWMVATALASRVAAGEPAPEPGSAWWYRFWHRVNIRPLAVVGVLAAVSAVLLPAMEVEAAAADEPVYGERLAPGLMEILTQSTVIPWLVALGFTTAFVHYLLDRAVYRLSDPAVRKAASGLLAPPTR